MDPKEIMLQKRKEAANRLRQTAKTLNQFADCVENERVRFVKTNPGVHKIATGAPVALTSSPIRNGESILGNLKQVGPAKTEDCRHELKRLRVDLTLDFCKRTNTFILLDEEERRLIHV